jgi:hypothetical protein
MGTQGYGEPVIMRKGTMKCRRKPWKLGGKLKSALESRFFIRLGYYGSFILIMNCISLLLVKVEAIKSVMLR